jgi:hypothetical protein
MELISIGLFKMLQKARTALLDRLWSHHICGCIFLCISLVSFAICLGYLIPIWIFSPIQTQCTVSTSNIQPKYIGNDYVTFKKYRTAIAVNYIGPGSKSISGFNYGPTNEFWSDLKERGFGLSLFYANQWNTTYAVPGRKMTCYYSLYDPTIVVFEYSPWYTWFLLAPFVPLIIGVLFCLYPTIHTCWHKRTKERELREEFAKFDAKRTEAQELRRKLAQQGGMGEVDSVNAKDFDPDEEPYQIEKIENIGNYFEEEKDVLLAPKEEFLLDLGN